MTHIANPHDKFFKEIFSDVVIILIIFIPLI